MTCSQQWCGRLPRTTHKIKIEGIMPRQSVALQATADSEVTQYSDPQPAASSDESAAEQDSVMKASRQSSQMQSRTDDVCSRRAATQGPRDGARRRSCECRWQAGCRQNGGERQTAGINHKRTLSNWASARQATVQHYVCCASQAIGG